MSEYSPTSLHVPSSEFLSHLSKHPEVPTRELLQPYLAYELWLRKAFAKGEIKLDHLVNLVPIYDGSESLFKIRTIDRETSARDKYIMPLKQHEQEVNDAPAIATSFQDYRNNFEAFTRGVLEGLDWSNVVVAGSSALLPLLSQRKDIRIWTDPAVENPLETYFQEVASSSDIDIFFYGLDNEDSAIERIIQLEATVRKNQRLSSECAIALRSGNAITFISPKYPYRHVQIILRLYKSISEILTGFDVDCACVAFDGKQVYSNPRGITAIATRTNTIDLSRRSPSYENRLYKYRSHNFDVYWETLERSRINVNNFHPEVEHKLLTGLSRLVIFETLLNKPRSAGPKNIFQRKRIMKKIRDSSEPMLTPASGYDTYEIPNGKNFTASSVRRHIELNWSHSYFGTIREVTTQGPSKGKNKGKLTGKVIFIKDNPGQQMIGSFYPLTEDDWTEIAYGDVNIEPEQVDHATLLWAAAEKGDILQVELLIKSNEDDLNTKDLKYGQSPLSIAAENGHASVVKLLLAHDNIDINSYDEGHQTPLLWAAAHGNKEVVELLLARDGIDLNAHDNTGKRTALSWAAQWGHEDIVELLLAQDDVEINAQDQNDRTPLLWAAAKGHSDVVRLLLAKADIDLDAHDSNCRTAFWWAVNKRHNEVVEQLIVKSNRDSKKKNG